MDFQQGLGPDEGLAFLTNFPVIFAGNAGTEFLGKGSKSAARKPAAPR